MGLKKSTAETWASLIKPEAEEKEEYDPDHMKEVLDAVFSHLTNQYSNLLQEQIECEECDIYEFIYYQNKRMMEVFDILEKRYGSQHIRDHRNHWFDRKIQVPENLKTFDMESIDSILSNFQ